ncbi:MAG: hypothetical protein JHC93_01220 [Parachlamydiales bacterium]|nr:hypothetical protein [Parachlamydiales bacterium]
MPNSKEFLTSEQISRRFNSSFDLVKHAVRLAKNMIRSGRGTRVQTTIQNRAYQILLEIADNKDVFDDIPEPEERTADMHHHQSDDALRKAQERKRHNLTY